MSAAVTCPLPFYYENGAWVEIRLTPAYSEPTRLRYPMKLPRTFVSLLVLSWLSVPLHAAPWRSSLYPENWKPGFADVQGHFLHDFSYAGYHAGERPIPAKTANVIDVTKPPYDADARGTTDATAAIQAALDAAAVAGGGVVYLPVGTYRVSPKDKAAFALQLSGDQVVLRGAGVDRTFLYCDSLEMRAKSVLLVKPQTPIWWESDGYPKVPLAQDLLTPTSTIPVADPKVFAKGDLILVRSDITQRFIDELGMTGVWKAGGKYPAGLIYCRRVTAVDTTAKTIRVDVPLRGFLRVADNARIMMPKMGRLLSESGLEDFSIGMRQHPGGRLDEDYENKLPEGTAGYAMHRATAITLDSVENVWIRRVNSYRPAGNTDNLHIQSHGIRLFRSRHVTVEDCKWRYPQYRGEGGNGYLFTLYGNDCLIKNCEAQGGRHNFSFGEMSANGNVLLNFVARDGRLPSDFHMFFSLANLIDNAVCDGDIVSGTLRGSGHGVTTTQSVFWNTEGRRYQEDYVYRDRPNKGHEFLVESHQWGDGYVIGTRGPASVVKSDDFVEGEGKGDSLLPRSLYEDQLARRLGRH